MTGPAADPVPPRSSGRLLLVVLAGLSALAPLCTDLYLPVMPRMAADLHAATSQAQLTITAVLIGLAVGQVLVGPLSDRYGRRPPLFIGLTVFMVTNLASAAAPAVGPLVAVRLVAGLAAAATVVVARAVVADIFPGVAAARAYASLGAIMGFVPAAAPVAGGLLSRVTSWRGMFVVLAGIAVAVLAAAWRFVPESLPPERRHPAGVAAVVSGLAGCLRSRRFMAYALTLGTIGGVLFSYIGNSSFVLEDLYGLSPTQYGFVFAANALGIMALANVSRQLAGRVPQELLLNIGQASCLVGASVLLLGVLLGAGLWGVLVGLFISISSMGLITSNGTTLGMRSAPGGAGAAAGVLGIFQFAVGGSLAPLGGLAASALPMALLIFGCALLAPVLRFALVRGAA